MNGIMMTTSAVQTMTSREIATLVESRHDKVKQSIERLVERGAIIQPPLGSEQSFDSMGRIRTEHTYLVGKRDSYIIVAQLSPEFTATLVDRWQELEAAVVQPTTLSRMQLIQLALAAENEVLALAAVVAVQTPKVIAFDRIATAVKGSFCIRDASKNLQMKEKELKEFLVKINWISARVKADGGLLPPVASAIKLKQGLMEQKITSGANWLTTQVRITAKGMAKLSEIICANASLSA